MKVAFVATGSSKAPLMKQMLGLEQVDDAQKILPAARVKLTNGTIHWFLDEAAATDLPGSFKSSNM